MSIRTALMNPITDGNYTSKSDKRRFPFGEDVPRGLGAYPPFGCDSLAMIGGGNTLLRFCRKKEKKRDEDEQIEENQKKNLNAVQQKKKLTSLIIVTSKSCPTRSPHFSSFVVLPSCCRDPICSGRFSSMHSFIC
jgi:hypothetical protein